METAIDWITQDIATMGDLIVHTLRDIYNAEHQIKKALPDMIEKATIPELKSGFQAHLDETEGHIQRLKRVFKQHGASRRRA